MDKFWNWIYHRGLCFKHEVAEGHAPIYDRKEMKLTLSKQMLIGYKFEYLVEKISNFSMIFSGSIEKMDSFLNKVIKEL